MFLSRMRSIALFIFLVLALSAQAQTPPVGGSPAAGEPFKMLAAPAIQIDLFRKATIAGASLVQGKGAHKIITPDHLFTVDRTVGVDFGSAKIEANGLLTADPEMMVREVDGAFVYGDDKHKDEKSLNIDCRMVAVNMIMADIDYEVLAQKNEGQQFDAFNIQSVKKGDIFTNEYIDARDGSSVARPGEQERMLWYKRVSSMDSAVAASLLGHINIVKNASSDAGAIECSSAKIVRGHQGEEERAGCAELTIKFKPPIAGKKFAFNQEACSSLVDMGIALENNIDLCRLSFQINACGLRYLQKTLSTFETATTDETAPNHDGLSDMIRKMLPGETKFVQRGTTLSSIYERQANEAAAAAQSGAPGSTAPRRRGGGFHPAVPVIEPGK